MNMFEVCCKDCTCEPDTSDSSSSPKCNCENGEQNSQDGSLLEDCQKPRDKWPRGENVTKDLPLKLEEIFFGGLKIMNITKRVLRDDKTRCTNAQEIVVQTKALKIPIKPGLPGCTKIVFPEAGDQAPFTIPGDIIFTTRDIPHDVFQRDGANLLMTAKVTLPESLLGTVITVTTIDGRVIRLKITSIITPDYIKLVPGEGLPLVKNWRERGDLVISFRIEFPLYLNIASKNDIRNAFTHASRHTAENNNEYIHRFVLDNKMFECTETTVSTR